MSFFINNLQTVFFRILRNFFQKYCWQKMSDHVLLNTCCGTQQIKTCASGSVVEHLLAKEGVAGSIPVSRSSVKNRIFDSVLFLCGERGRTSRPRSRARSLACRLGRFFCLSGRGVHWTPETSRALLDKKKHFASSFLLFSEGDWTSRPQISFFESFWLEASLSRVFGYNLSI